MRAVTILLIIAALVTNGCATHSATTRDQFSKKREEIEVLREELVIAITNLDHLQRELASQGGYPTEAQARDLDYFISVVRQARDKVAAEDRRIHQQYRVSYGPL
jgi:hypothetical protein